MRPTLFLTALLFIFAPALLVAETVAPAGPSEKPLRLPPVSGTNNSKTPTEIQIMVPGQPTYSTTIPPSRKAATALPLPGNAACMRMKAPYRSGLWEITSVSSNSLMPQAITAKVKRCITERDAQNACGLNQLSGGRNRDCHITDMQIGEGDARWSMSCDSASFNGQGNGHTTFTADAYQGTFDMRATMQGTPMEMNTSFSGKRLGNCK